MSFKLGNIIVDHLQYGFAEGSDGTPLYVASQLNEATISITSDPTEINDARGNRVFSIYNNKNGELTATSAFLSLPLIAAKSGIDPEIATTTNGIKMPAIIEVNKGNTLTLENYTDGDPISVSEYTTTGDLGKVYTKGDEAGADKYAVASGVLTLPTDEEVDRFIVKYTRNVTDGVKITNRADKMPKAHKLTFKAIIRDQCAPDVLRAAYIYLPNFQPSPEMEINFAGGDTQTLAYSGQLGINICSAEKELYTIFVANETEDDLFDNITPVVGG